MKAIIFFTVCLAIILPLYHVQKGDVFDVEGLKEIYFVKMDDGKAVYEKQNKTNFEIGDLSNNEGVIITIDGEIDKAIESFDIKIIKTEEIEGLNVLYGYTNMYNDFIYIDGKQSNVQLVQNQNEIIVGFPIILSGF